jgi:hypothetical protein
MSTGAIIAIIVVVLVLILLVAFLMPRMGARRRQRELERRRGEVADAHREEASSRAARAEEAERIAEAERAQAEAHETRARLHERGLADDDLDTEHDRMSGDSRFERDTPEERPTTR